MNKSKKDTLHIATLDSLLGQRFPIARWMVQHIIPEGGLTILSAAPGSFKTWLMIEVALAVAEGRKLFDQYETSKAGVLLVDEESGPRMLQERFRAMGSPRGLPVHYISRQNTKVTQEYVAQLIEVCNKNHINLVMFDSLVRLHQGDENTSKDMAELFNFFKGLTDSGISVLIAHHNRKGMPGSYSPSNDMRGSSDILAAVDCHLALNRRGNSEYVEVYQTKNRYSPELHPFKLRFAKHEDYNKFTFMGSLSTKSDRRSELKEAIITQLTANPYPTKKDLLSALNGKEIDIKNGLLGELLEELRSDEVVDIKAGSRNAIHYFLKDSEKVSAPKTQ